MGIKVTWENTEKTVLVYKFDEQWSWEDFYTSKKAAYDLIDTVKHPVAVIFDTPPRLYIPPLMLTQSKSAVEKTHANTNIVIISVSNMYARTMLQMVIKLSPRAAKIMRLVPTIEEARTLAAQHLASLTPLPSP
jgi:hypothetical protein